MDSLKKNTFIFTTPEIHQGSSEVIWLFRAVYYISPIRGNGKEKWVDVFYMQWGKGSQSSP